jgi:hypothetical protein
MKTKTKTKTKPKNTKQIRVSLKHYEAIRLLAFRAHRPMTEILEGLIEIKKA